MVDQSNRKFFIVANPFSGRGRAQYALIQLKKRLDLEGYYYAVFITPRSEIMDEFIEENLFTDTTDVIVLGGDGTINATVNVIHKMNVTLHIIPTGTGNDFVKTIDIGKGLDEHIETILKGSPRTIDIGDCNGKKFINGIGIGFDGQIVHDQVRRKGFLKGHAKYYSLVLKILGSYRSRPFEFKLDGQKIIGRFILMAIHNGTTFGGGFKLNPDSKIDDGLLSICTIDPISAFRRFANISKLSFGTHGKLEEVKFYKGQTIEISACEKTLHAHIDGEYLGEPPFNIKIIPDAIKVQVREIHQPFS